jgi:hypothetical protein
MHELWPLLLNFDIPADIIEGCVGILNGSMFAMVLCGV